MKPRWLSLPLFAGSLLALASCYYHETQTTGQVYIRSSVPQCPVKDLALAEPTVAVFVGVSTYAPTAGVYSTPAHFIGASLLSGLFGRAGHLAGPGMYDSTTLTDLPDRDRLPKEIANPVNVVSAMGYGGGGSSELVRRARIETSLAEGIAAAERTHEKQGRVMLVIYVAAHGWLGPDGQPYFLAADAVEKDPATWISYRSVLESVEAFLGRNAPGSTSRSALVIFDTCQISPGGMDMPPAALPTAPGLVLVQSTSPGQYAWHWTGTDVMTQHVDVVKETRIGVGLPPKARRGDFTTELSSTMSVLPLANQCSLADATRAHKAQAGTDDRQIGAREWFASLKRKSAFYLAQIPEMQQLGRRQDISIAVAEAQADRPLFVLRTPKPEDDKP